jgi:RecA-family ATPase
MDDFNSPAWVDDVPPVSAYEADERIDNVAPLRGEEPAGTASAGRTPVAPLETLDLSTVPADDVPDRKWVVRDLIPDRNVTDLSGDGGLGKSLLGVPTGNQIRAYW